MILPLLALILLAASPMSAVADYVVVDTGQTTCYDNTDEIPCPQPGEPFYGQDAQHDGSQPSYTLSGDGLTVYDNNTGLTWQQSPDTDGVGDIDADDKLTWTEAQAYPATLNGQSYGGYDDWRLPSIKELYSLIDFSGSTGTSAATSVRYIDTDYFDFAYGDESAGERFIDAQYWSSTEYVGTTMNGDATVFGVNFADGRIKGYPRDTGPGGQPFTKFVRYVRGNADYGVNDFVDNGDGTITDLATGLMWQKGDSGTTRNWEQALDYAESLVQAGYDDWRLPNAKELQSIVDYTRAPDATNPAQQGPAVDPIFDITSDDSFFWTGTTHVQHDTGHFAAYIAFGEAWGWMQQPPGSGNYVLQNVHGAGAQRSDPKAGDPADYPYGLGPQGDVIRIYNYVRAVRTPTSPATPTPAASPTEVGGTAELPDVAGSPVETTDSSARNYILVAGGVAVAVAAVAGSVYATRRWRSSGSEKRR
jgi:hypothetical protein